MRGRKLRETFVHEKHDVSHPYTFFLSLFIFERGRERQNASGGRAEREGDAESEAGSGL